MVSEKKRTNHALGIIKEGKNYAATWKKVKLMRRVFIKKGNNCTVSKNTIYT